MNGGGPSTAERYRHPDTDPLRARMARRLFEIAVAAKKEENLARRVGKVGSGETSPRRPTKEKEHEVQGYFFDYEMYRQRREEYRREARTLRQAGVVGAESNRLESQGFRT